MKGFVYILLCADGSFYTGSTNDLEWRMAEHQKVEGANHTRKRLPVELVNAEEFDRIDEANYHERQIHGWSHDKKIALKDEMRICRCWQKAIRMLSSTCLLADFGVSSIERSGSAAPNNN